MNVSLDMVQMSADNRDVREPHVIRLFHNFRVSGVDDQNHPIICTVRTRDDYRRVVRMAQHELLFVLVSQLIYCSRMVSEVKERYLRYH